MEPKKKIRKEHILWQLFSEFALLGLLTPGGGMAMVAILQDRMAEKRKWLSSEEALDCIAVSQTLPGVVAINMSVYVGYRKAGIPGAIVSCFGMVLPSFVMIILIAMFLGEFYENPYVAGAMKGIRAAVLGVMAYTLLKMGRQTLKAKDGDKKLLGFGWCMAIAVFLLITFAKIDVAWIILSAMIVGIFFFTVILKKGKGSEEK